MSFKDLFIAQEEKKKKQTEAKAEIEPISEVKDQIEDQLSGHPDVRNPGDRVTAEGVRVTTVEDSDFIELSGDRVTGRPGDHKTGNDEEFWPSRQQRHRLSVRLPNNKVKRYKIWCLENGMDLQTAIEKAMDLLIGHPDARSPDNTGHPDTRNNLSPGRPHDSDHEDNLIDDKLSSIRVIYKDLTGNNWNSRDTEAYNEVSNYDGLAIEAGLKLAFCRAKQRIGSFRYCLSCIEEIVRGKTIAKDYIWRLNKEIEKKRGS